MKKQKVEIKRSKQAPAVFLAQIGDLAKRKGLKLLEEFKKANIMVEESFGRDSLKAQLNRADRLKVDFSLILGQKEALDETIIIRNMESGKQETVKLDKVVEKVKQMLKK